MNNDPDHDGDVAAPVFVEDLFLTDVFLIKGRLQNKTKRLSNMLEDHQRSYLTVEDATLVSLRSSEVIKTPKVMVNVRELICAHELVDVAGDDALRRLADNDWIAAGEYTIADMAIMPWLRNPDKQGIDGSKYPNLLRWRDRIWKRPQVEAALETLSANNRKDNSFSDKGWEIMYGKTQSSQGQAAE